VRLLSRPVAVAVAVLVQAALVAWAVQPQLSPRLTGTDHRLAVEPVDPYDPFRGAYVQLDYPGLPAEAPGSGRFHVPLVRDGSLWKGTAPVRTRPEPPYLTCEARGGFLDCGLDSFFASEDRARALEQDVTAGRLAAVIRVDDQGRAALIDLEHR